MSQRSRAEGATSTSAGAEKEASIPTLAIIHTTTATIEPLARLAEQVIPGVRVINFVDDSILQQLARNGAGLPDVEDKLIHYARFAQQAGADVILESCASIGEVAIVMQEAVSIPVVRIDAAVAKTVARLGPRIGVAATLPMTLRPTARLIQEEVAATGRAVEVVPRLIEGAYERLMAGQREEHDRLVIETLTQLAGEVDVVVLAQATMARVLDWLPGKYAGRFFSSPQPALEQVKSLLQQQ